MRRVVGIFVISWLSAELRPCRQSVFCQGWQLCVKNAAPLERIATTWGPLPMLLSMMSVGLRLFSLAQ
jgi:hypothetical protein